MCLSQDRQSPRGFIPAAPDLLPNDKAQLEQDSKPTSQKTTPGFRIRVPFMDMEIQNERNLFVVQEKTKKEEIFVLHGGELYQLFVDRNEKRLSLVGHLGGGAAKDVELHGAEVIKWRNFHILVIAMDEHLEVYEISNNVFEMRAKITSDPKRRNETSPTFESIQQLSLPGKYKQHFLTDPDEENIMLIVGINFTKLYGRLHTFLWSNSYFEPLEELTVPPLDVLHIVGVYPKYLIRGRIINHQTKTIINVTKLQTPTMTLQAIQTFTANSRVIHATSFRNQNFLIACSSRQQKQCNSFRMNADGLFSVFLQRSSQDLTFDKVVGAKNFVVAAHQNQVSVYTNGRLDCYARFITNVSDITSIQTIVNGHDENFILLNYKRPFHTLVRFVELEFETGHMLGSTGMNVTEHEDPSTLVRHRHIFEETIGMLRSLLLRRRNAMNTFRRISNERMAQSLKLKVSHPIRVHGGNINVIKVMGQNLLSPLQMLQRIEGMRNKFGLRRRTKREVSNNNTMNPNYTNSPLIKVKYLKINNLIYEDSILKGFHLDNKAKTLPILSIQPKVTANTLTAHKLSFKRGLNGAAAFNATLPVTKLSSLNVESINNMPWLEFYENTFLKNRDNEVHGNLTMKAPIKIVNMTAGVMNELHIDNLFNLERPQIVHADILFSGFLLKHLQAETINGLDFANDIVFQNTDDLIESPVNMYRLSIENDLLLDENATIVSHRPNEDQNDFQQYYTGRVLINGSLTVKNLLTEETEPVMIDGNPFSRAHVMENYFLQNEPQVFNRTVIFGNANVTVPSLSTNYLNYNAVDEHLLADEPSQFKQPMLLVFMNALIEGDLSSETIATRIANLSRNAVRRGDVANITGIKTFKAPLTIEHVMTLTMNETPVTDLILKSQLKGGDLKFRGIKTFNNVIASEEAIVHKSVNVTKLNKLPLDEFLNYNYHIEKLRVPFKLDAKNIVFDKINDICFDEVFNNFKLRDGQLVLHKEFIIDGNASFDENLNVTNINGIDWDAYQADLVSSNDDKAIIKGTKHFLDELTITNGLRTPTLNDIIIEEIFNKILSKSRAQLIKGAYTFDRLKLSNLDVPIINNMPITEFIDLRMEKLTIESDIIVPKVMIFGDVSANKGHELLNLDNFIEQISLLPNKIWRNIVVTQNAFWQDDGHSGKIQREQLNYLQRYAVQRYAQQVITGNVKLKRPILKNMTANSTLLDEIDFDYLFRDCVLKKSNETQIIAARKSFLMNVHTFDVAAKSYLSSKLVNGIDILRLNNSIYYLSSNELITGPLHFVTPPKIERLIVKGLINTMNPLAIYHNRTQMVPSIKISKLTIDECLEIDDINNINLNRLLANRIKKQSVESKDITGFLNIENLILNKKVSVQAINGLSIKKMIFKQSKHLQSISGVKTIEGALKLAGPAHVLHLNGDHLTEKYQQSLFINRNYHHDKLIIDGATFEKGIILAKPAFPLLASTMEDSTTTAIGRKYKVIEHELHQIDRILNEKSQKNKNLLYIDYGANIWQTSWQTPSNNITTHKRLMFEHKNSSLCERRYTIVQIAQSNTVAGQIFLTNFTTNIITASNYNISVKAENYCHHKYRKAKSKITITSANHERVIGMKKYIESVMIFSPDKNDTIFLLLHASDLSRNQHEIRVLKVITSHEENNITDWQSLTLGVGKTLRLYAYTNFTVLISGGGMLKHHPVLAIYHFDRETQKFVLAQSIDGDFDIHELLPTQAHGNFQLILSCRQCQRVHIYSVNPWSIETPYKIFQILKLKTLIDRVKPFKIDDDGSVYLMFLAENGQHYYYLYRFSQLQGWLHVTYGYYENTELALPLMGDEELHLDESNLLALLCSVNKCNVVRAVVV